MTLFLLDTPGIELDNVSCFAFNSGGQYYRTALVDTIDSEEIRTRVDGAIHPKLPTTMAMPIPTPGVSDKRTVAGCGTSAMAEGTLNIVAHDEKSACVYYFT